MAEEERASVDSFLSFSQRNHEEMRVLFNQSALHAIAYVGYILAPDLQSSASAYVYNVLKNGMDVHEFNRLYGNDLRNGD
ncbi:hypothetical protein ACO0LD_18295 [Undibacterium sp. Ji83W]|uniref:hypothetical protein n=1 Tax=Undibacterium sp. Ji83W TaxID=3413043 RepID=UPI003BF21995